MRLSESRQQKDRRHLIRISNEASTTALTGRKALLRVRELLEARTREVVAGYGDDGIEIYDRVTLTADDRLSNLRAARVWCSKAENELQHLRNQIDRAIEIAERSAG